MKAQCTNLVSSPRGQAPPARCASAFKELLYACAIQNTQHIPQMLVEELQAFVDNTQRIHQVTRSVLY